MRRMFGWLAAWCLLSAISYWWSRDVVERSVRHWHAREMQRSLAAIAEIAGAVPWVSPWENDPRWLELEKQLELDLVPIHTAADAPQRAEPPSSQVHSAQSPAPSPTVFRYDGPDGQLRATMTLPLAGSSQHSAVAIRGTRVIGPSKIIDAWWYTWIASTALGGLAITVAITWQWRQSRRSAARLAPWVKITTQDVPASEAALPPAAARPGDREQWQLDAVRTTVNRWLAELQQSSHRSGQVLGNMLEGVLAVDERFRVWLANSALLRMFDVSADDYLMRPLVEVLREPQVAQLVAEVVATSQMKENLLEVGGAPRKYLRLRAYPLPLPAGARGVIVTVRDETQLQQSELIRRDFVTNASHELKTPLAAIRAYAETLQMGALSDGPNAERFVSHIIQQADRMDQLVSGMLQLAHVQAGAQSLDIRKFDAAQAAQSTLDAVAGLAAAKKVNLTPSYQLQPMTVHSDREAFTTILSNLLSNAIRYTPPGGSVRVNLSLDAEWFILVVSDTGVGIPEEDQQRIFERFYRVEKDRDGARGGTGLGLSIVKHLVQSLGGVVTVTSRVNAGSSFEVRLPVSV